MSKEANVLDQKTLKEQSTDLSEDQKAALRDEAIAERSKKPEGEKDKKETEDKEEDGEKDKKAPLNKEKEEETQDDLTPEQEAEKEKADKEAKDKADKEAKDKANKELLEKPEEELSEGDKKKKAILLKDKAEADFNQEAEAFSKEKNIPLDDAKKELVSYNKIAEKYKNNPKEMAKALLSSQREFLKLQDEHKKLKDAPQPANLKPGEAIIGGKLHSAEQVREILITGYREENPELTDGMEEDKIYKLAVAQMKERQKSAQETANKQLSLDAKEKRSKVLSGLSDSEKEYSEEITTLVNDTPDHVIMHEEWSLDDVKAWARGRYFSPEKVEDIRKEAFKKGREEAEILGVKENESPKPSSGKTPPKKKTFAEQLTEEDKDRARNMYRTEGLTDEQKFEMFLDFKNHTKKK